MAGLLSAMELDVISVIRSLEGDTLGDICKKFYKYIINQKDEISPNIETIFASFIPENNLERFFKIKLIDIWRSKAELARIFEDEDTFYVSQALKCKWFFKNVDIDSAVLVNEILPNLSYFTRQKLINQYSKYLKDQSKAEEIFKALQKRYGTAFALKILPACSSEFVEATLQVTRARPNKNLIKLLFKHHPDVVKNFFCFALENKASGNRLYTNFELRNYEETLGLIAIYYPACFIDMVVKYRNDFPYMKLGTNVTRKFAKTLSTLVIKHFNTLKEVLTLEKVIKYMSMTQIEKLQASCFPDSITKFFQLGWQVEELGKITSRLEESDRNQIFLRNFKKCYGKEFSIEDFAKVTDLDLILLLPIEIRIEWIHLMLPTLEPECKKAEYLSYIPPDRAVPQIMEMVVRQKEVKVRGDMVYYMLLSAIRYKKTHNQMSECFAFIVRRLRNDNKVIRMKALLELEEMKDILLNMSIEEFATVDEFIDLIRMNDEEENFMYEFLELLSIRIQRYFAAGRPMDDEIRKFLELVFSMDYFYYDFNLCKGTVYRKKCLEIILSALPNLVTEKKKTKDEALISVFCTICEYNHSFKHDKIDCPQWLLTEVERLLQSKECDDFSKARLIKATTKDADIMKKIYDNIFRFSPRVDVIRYVLHANPLQIKQHKESLIKEILRSKKINHYFKLFKTITLYTPFGLPLAFRELCELVIKAADLDPEVYKPSFKPNAFALLSILMPTKDFIKIIKAYKPTKEEIGRYSEANKLQCKIQEAIASSLKLVTSPMEILPCVKYYAVGDYLKLVLGSLNSICSKVPEKKILPLVLAWLDCPLSLKKHLIRSYCKVAPAADAGKLIVSLLDKEKNISLRLLLFEQIFQFFLSDPCEERFIFFKTAYSQLTHKDVNCLGELFNLEQIPDLFVAPFIEMLWQAVELKEGVLVSNNRNRIIEMIDGEILYLLSEDFCDILLKQSFSNDNLADGLQFITNYLLYAPEETSLKTRLEKIAKYLGEIVQNDWNKFNPDCNIVFKSKNYIYRITESICQGSLEKEKLKIYPCSLLENWKLFLLSLFSTNEIIDELLLLESAIFMSTNDVEKDDFIAELAKFYEDLLTKYCTSYGNEIITTVVSFLPNCLEKERTKLAKALLCEHKSYQAHLMAIKLTDTQITKEINTYKVIIECLLKCTHPHVKYAAESLMRKLNSEVEITED